MVAPPARLRAGVEVACWWAGLMGVWLVTLSSLNASELAISAIVALPCAVVALLARKDFEARWAPAIGWVRWFLPLPGAVVSDTMSVLSLPLRTAARRQPWEGQLRELSLPAGDEVARATTRSAVGTLLISATPTTFVVESRPDERRMVVHSLVKDPTSIEEAVGK